MKRNAARSQHCTIHDDEAFRKDGPRVFAGLNDRPDLGCRRRLLVKMDQHGRALSRSSLRTDLAMNRADRRGLM